MLLIPWQATYITSSQFYHLQNQGESYLTRLLWRMCEIRRICNFTCMFNMCKFPCPVNTFNRIQLGDFSIFNSLTKHLFNLQFCKTLSVAWFLKHAPVILKFYDLYIILIFKNQQIVAGPVGCLSNSHFHLSVTKEVLN